MSSFVQIMEYETERPDDIKALGDEMQYAHEREPFVMLLTTRDRDNPNHYMTLVEFPSYEDAMANSNAPETRKFAAEMAKLCSGPVRFHNLDVQYRRP